MSSALTAHKIWVSEQFNPHLMKPVEAFVSALSLKVQKKTEKINEDLLSETSESKGIWDSIVRYVEYNFNLISCGQF